MEIKGFLIFLLDDGRSQIRIFDFQIRIREAQLQIHGSGTLTYKKYETRHR
jgi:hypothetical protein